MHSASRSDETRNRAIAELLGKAIRISREGRMPVRHIDMRRFEAEMLVASEGTRMPISNIHAITVRVITYLLTGMRQRVALRAVTAWGITEGCAAIGGILGGAQANRTW